MRNIIFGSIFSALGIFIFTQTFHFPSFEKGHPGPGLFPNLLAILFIIFGGALILKSWRHPPKELEEKVISSPQKITNALFVLGIIVVFILVVNTVGFLITSVVLLFILMKKLGVTILKGVLVSIIITLFIHLMFSRVLRVPLPPGIFSW